MFWWTVIGTVASAIGLGVGVYVIFVAKGAREAAEAARALARKRSLVEELEGASQKIQQVGQFIQQEQWLAVRMRTEEILSVCKVTLSRWPDHLSMERRNEVITASSLVRSIAMTAAECASGVLTPKQKRSMNDAHLRASEHISSALGEARREEERSEGNSHGN